MNLVTKVNVPREVLPIASVGGSLVDFAASSLVFIGLLFFYRVQIHATILWIPYLIVVQICLAIGVTLLLSTLNVFYRDIRFAVPLAIQIWMYASPVIYPLSSVPESLQPLYLLNPAAGLIESYRSVILRGETPLPAYLLPMTLISVLILIFSYLLFKRLEWRFADVI
jgi:lipopolysaccharide transport system permease protein